MITVLQRINSAEPDSKSGLSTKRLRSCTPRYDDQNTWGVIALFDDHESFLLLLPGMGVEVRVPLRIDGSTRFVPTSLGNESAGVDNRDPSTSGAFLMTEL